MEKIKKSSIEAAADINEFFDFIYIDADHEYESVKKDIEAWIPRLRSGGIIAGHDYIGYRGVHDAVNERFGNPDRVFFDSSWLIHGSAF